TVINRPPAGKARAIQIALTGLLRSIGIPAKTVTGFYYAAGSFGLHSWVEVYLNEWIPIDPVLGQVPADARHVRLLDDALARPIQVAEYLGAVTVQLIGLGS
ncbi:MAG: transglutaminase-like domain-containing protein, partial [Gemmatimonadales bacterium]